MLAIGCILPLVALTGGFIGRHLLKAMTKCGYKIRVLLRPTRLPMAASGAVVGDLAAARNMSDALAGIDAVIHSAGLTHRDVRLRGGRLPGH